MIDLCRTLLCSLTKKRVYCSGMTEGMDLVTIVTRLSYLDETVAELYHSLCLNKSLEY